MSGEGATPQPAEALALREQIQAAWPCRCHAAYIELKRIDPACPQCDYIDDVMRSALGAHIGAV